MAHLHKIISAIVIISVVTACAPAKRATKQPTEFQSLTEAFIRQNNIDYDAGLETIFKRMELKVADADNPHDVTFDILILHGGGAAGGFAAGFLIGWGEIEDPRFTRPEFDFVTGASSGALVAPFAFVGGDHSYQRAYDLALNPPQFGAPSIFSLWPTRPSVLSNAALKEVISSEFGAEMIAQIMQGADEHRSLLIGTTELELGYAKAWDMTTAARNLSPEEAQQRLHDVLLASTALPVAFPTVEIDGQLYTDGGVATTMFLGVDANGIRAIAQRWQQVHPDWPIPKIRVWIIINAKLHIDKRTVQTQYFDVAMRSIEIMMAYDRIKALFAMAYLVTQMNTFDGVQAEFRYITIPESATIPKDLTEMGDKSMIHNLVELGRKLGAAKDSWTIGTPQVYRMQEPHTQKSFGRSP